MIHVQQAAKFFIDHRRSQTVADNLPPDWRPTDAATAYAIQGALVERLLARHGGRAVGYKIACTNTSAQRLLNIDAPVFGRLLSSFMHTSGARRPANDFRVRCIEPEYAFQMADDVPSRDAPYAAQNIAEFVGAVLPSIEIVNHHFTDWTQVGGFVLAADNAIHGAWVPGEPIPQWRELDLQNQTVTLSVGGKTITTGSGSNVLGHPLNVLAWLANELPRYGLQLNKGDFVTTGVTTDVYLAKAGDRIDADFGPAGRVKLVFE